MATPRTAIQNLRTLWAIKDYRKALKLAASWPRLGNHRDTIRTGWSAAYNPRFYEEMGRDPGALYRAGLVAICERYDLPYPEDLQCLGPKPLRK